MEVLLTLLPLPLRRRRIVHSCSVKRYVLSLRLFSRRSLKFLRSRMRLVSRASSQKVAPVLAICLLSKLSILILERMFRLSKIQYSPKKPLTNILSTLSTVRYCLQRSLIFLPSFTVLNRRNSFLASRIFADSSRSYRTAIRTFWQPPCPRFQQADA